ncbi:hypothetical protein Hamer_G003511 [Homarus americanus]|uniref:Uncharacterized protein n=1 Tax=Homarus americanus TaxID=6706 RepID=A0A8J5JU88_HOMAM|nr:hypothetical protein Hamer_G003511 [Homarus americanus]
MKRSVICIGTDSMVKQSESHNIASRLAMSTGKSFHISQPVFMPTTTNSNVVSEPVSVRNKGKVPTRGRAVMLPSEKSPIVQTITVWGIRL